MIKKWNITIPEFTGEITRRAYVYLPDEAGLYPERRYPVLYMFDGHNVFFDEDATFGKSWGMEDYADLNGLEMIIAAVECDNCSKNGRLSEYSPVDFAFEGAGEIKGRGDETMHWLIDMFKPYIDSEYPTMPDREHTFIAGSSLGGLMSLYAVSKYNAVFSRAAALSPSLWIAPEKVYGFMEEADFADKTVVYMDYGSLEMKNHPGMRSCLTDAATLLIEKGVLLDCRIVPNGKHNEASWEKQIPFFMNTLFYNLGR